MISVHPYLFFGLIELAAFLAIVCGFLFWKWRKVSGQFQGIEVRWAEARAGTETAIAALNTGLGRDSPGVGRRIAGLKALQAIFGPDPTAGSAAWKTASSSIMALVAEMEEESSAMAEECSELTKAIDRRQREDRAEAQFGKVIDQALNHDQVPEGDSERQAIREFGEMDALISEQNKKLAELSQYKTTVVNLSTNLQRVNAANRKLVEYLHTVSTDDEKFRVLYQMVQKLQQSGQALEVTVQELEHEKAQLEPKVKALNIQNERMLAALSHHKKQAAKALVERDDLRTKIQDLEQRIAMRTKSYDRLHKKFDALRREYLSLYQLSTKEGKLAKAHAPH